MTFTGEEYCRPGGCFAAQQEEAFTIGQAGRLCVLAPYEGIARFWDGTEQYLPAGGLLVLAGPLELKPAGGPFAYNGVWLKGKAAITFASEMQGPLLLPPAACPEGEGLLFRLQQEGAPAAQSAAAFGLLCLLAQAPRGEAALPPLVAEALSEIHGHYGEVYGVEELAAGMGVSKGHLIRSFKAALNTSPGRYLALVRIQAAKRLLLEGLGLEAVAGLCGFAGANYLCRVFKKEVGLSPAAWQRQNALMPKKSRPPLAEWEEALYL